MKVISTILLILICSYSYAQDTAYIVVVDYIFINETKCTKTASINVIEQMYFRHFKQNIDVNKQLSGTNVFFEHRNNNIRFYCEKKIIVKKRNGKIKYKKIKRRD